jgi:hypothetical protein
MFYEYANISFASRLFFNLISIFCSFFRREIVVDDKATPLPTTTTTTKELIFD